MVDAALPEPGLPERPIADPAARPVAADAPPRPPHLSDPRALTILTTEHWSLLTARSLVYNESFSRGAMFLTFLSASLVALGFVSSGASREAVPLVVMTLLALDLFVGIATLGRIVAASSEEFRALQGMGRLRHAYLEMIPTLEPYFTTARNDDMLSVLAAYGATVERPRPAANALHGLTTMPGMIAVIDATIAGALAATLAGVLGAGSTPAVVVGVVTGGLLFAAVVRLAGRLFMAQERLMDIRFPSALPGDQPSRRKT